MPSPKEKRTLSVSELNRAAKKLLEGEFPQVGVEGELSNFSRPASGHWYFTLKDSKAQIRCAMFRGYNARLKFSPDNGDRVEVSGKVSLYEGRGDFQLIAEAMSPAGLGLLQQRFEELKTKLADAGYFSAEHKRELPAIVRRLAVITSPSGAAIQDVISVLQRRNPFLQVDIYPSLVQGEGAAASIKNQLLIADSEQYDLILLTRGGGSLEDLWAFNDEALAEAIFSARTPIISAVGHEIDFSISDFVADLRAPTPSAAAELLSRDMGEVSLQLGDMDERLARAINRLFSGFKKDLRAVRSGLRNPIDRIQQLAQSFDFQESQLTQALASGLTERRHQLHSQKLRLGAKHPGKEIEGRRERLDFFQRRLRNAAQSGATSAKRRQLDRLLQRLEKCSPRPKLQSKNAKLDTLKKLLLQLQTEHLNKSRGRLESAAQALRLTDPTAIMERGYAIAFKDGRAIRSANELSTDDLLALRFYDGESLAKVLDSNSKAAKS